MCIRDGDPARGIAVGAACVALLAQMSLPFEPDPSGASPRTVVVARGVILLVAAVGLIAALWPDRRDSAGPA